MSELQNLANDSLSALQSSGVSLSASLATLASSKWTVVSAVCLLVGHTFVQRSAGIGVGPGVMGAGVMGAGVMGAGVMGAAVTGAAVTGAAVTGAAVTGAAVTGAAVMGA